MVRHLAPVLSSPPRKQVRDTREEDAMGEKERGVEGATEKAVGETGGGGIAIDEEGVQ